MSCCSVLERMLFSMAGVCVLIEKVEYQLITARFVEVDEWLIHTGKKSKLQHCWRRHRRNVCIID